MEAKRSIWLQAEFGPTFEGFDRLTTELTSIFANEPCAKWNIVTKIEVEAEESEQHTDMGHTN